MEGDTEISVSHISFLPKASDHGRNITCRAENTILQDSAIADSFQLDVHCKFVTKHIVLTNYWYYISKGFKLKKKRPTIWSFMLT